ncbi:hypothetical protein H5410_055799 [Solanum commersonii]|uniref:6-phosphogluconate dehydrogenase NADP-binding domain-containing protein n=1 Tax=Solanum commersonii TaxID=4109 RepID=A0A9J5WIJ5_SOLCO|nr:hypothetical protein H5410_055799 [Solanum commersonii]
MGNPMAQNLIKAGCDVTVWNRTKSKCEPLISLGAKYKSSPEEVATSCDVTFAMLADPESAVRVYLSGCCLWKIWSCKRMGLGKGDMYRCIVLDEKKFKWLPHYTDAIRRLNVYNASSSNGQSSQEDNQAYDEDEGGDDSDSMNDSGSAHDSDSVNESED